MTEESAVIIGPYALEHKTVECLLCADNTGYVHIRLDLYYHAFVKQGINSCVHAYHRILNHSQTHARIGYGYVLRESHNLVAYLALEPTCYCQSQDHNGQTHRYSCSGNDNGRTRAALDSLVPTVQPVGQKLLHN